MHAARYKAHECGRMQAAQWRGQLPRGQGRAHAYTSVAFPTATMHRRDDFLYHCSPLPLRLFAGALRQNVGGPELVGGRASTLYCGCDR